MPHNPSKESLIAQRFSNALNHYHTYATIQRKMAKGLFALALPIINQYQIKSYGSTHAPLSLLELGCGTGLLTEQLIQLKLSHYIANDLYPQAGHFIAPLFQERLINYKFKCGNACQIKLSETVNIIAGNAVLQWIDEKSLLFHQMNHLLKTQGLLILSTFLPNHYQEIKLLTGQGLHYPTLKEITALLAPHFNIISHKCYQKRLYFNSPLCVLKHIQLTGVNAISKRQWTKSDLQSFTKNYQTFKTAKGYPLTYTPLLLV
ncbi:MAG: methyltransferase domain-containing protein, partial [Ostreibacterium sp.]